MNPKTIATRKFASVDQQRFASFSSDWNPMHMDAVAARRTQAGKAVVHGVHVFLWAIETLLQQGVVLADLKKAKVRFNKFVYLDTVIKLVLVKQTENSINLEVHDDSLNLATIKCSLGCYNEAPVQPTIDVNNLDFPHVQTATIPQDLDFDSMSEIQGVINDATLSQDSDPIHFSNMESLWGIEFVRSVAKLSTLVGMHCPGLHSIFSGFTLTRNESATAPGLIFKVSNADSRFNLINMEVQGFGFNASVDAFVRQKPLNLPSLKELTTFVPEACFDSINALIVGGSRGLGEATARLITAGNGNVTITYANGKVDAENLQNELNSQKECCSIQKFDAMNNVQQQVSNIENNFTHLFYFATPQIFRQNKTTFDSQVLEEFMQVYVHAFNDLCLHMATTIHSKKPTIFYPSSKAIDQRPKGLTEYAMAKVAGEILCNDLADQHKLRIIVERLPRVNTDQTATVTPVQSDNAVTLMYRHLLESIDTPISSVA